MRPFRDRSINTKLSLLMAAVGGVALLVSTVGFGINDVSMLRSSKVTQLSALASVLGSNSTAALMFNDHKGAADLLKSLRRQPTIECAYLFDAEGRLFAEYHEEANVHPRPSAPDSTGHAFTDDRRLVVTHQIADSEGRIGSLYLRASMDDLHDQLVRYTAIVASVIVVSLGASFLLSSRLHRVVSVPILRLARTAQQISSDGDYSVRVRKNANDELGTLYDEFNAMLNRIQRGERQLKEAHDQLEGRVCELSREVADRKRAENELEAVHRQLLDTARRAGMAEIATGVLHNVGNVLNSINVSATVVSDKLRNSRLADLTRAVDLMTQHLGDLGAFMTTHERGKRLPDFLILLSKHLDRERDSLLQELRSLTKNVDHVNTIVAMQQSYAGVAGVIETVALADLLDDALKLNASSLGKYEIELVRDYAEMPEVRVEKQKLLQILVNLVANAKDSLIESAQQRRRLTVRIAMSGEDRVQIDVMDNGVGIAEENLTRIFSHGFTTKKHGHGFGLHSSANAAKEMDGSLSAYSDGPGQGAIFTLELPFQPVEVHI